MRLIAKLEGIDSGRKVEVFEREDKTVEVHEHSPGDVEISSYQEIKEAMPFLLGWLEHYTDE